MTDQHQKLIKLQRCIFTCQRFSLLLKAELGNLINVYVNNTDLDLLQNSGSLINAYTVYSLDTATLRLRYFGKWIQLKEFAPILQRETTFVERSLPPFQKMGLHLKERICSFVEQILSFKSSPTEKRGKYFHVSYFTWLYSYSPYMLTVKFLGRPWIG